MKVYFLAAQPCALTLNDAYFGIADRFERFAQLCLRDNIFVRFSPENALPIGFFLTEDIRFHPPKGCEVYLLPDGIAIFARDFMPNDFTLRILAQQRQQNCLVTVFCQGAPQLSIESEHGFFVKPLPPAFSDCTLSFEGGLLFLKAPQTLAIYTKKGECLFLEDVSDFSLQGKTLRATLPLSDRLGRSAECIYELDDNACTRTQCTLRQNRTFNGEAQPEKIAQELLPYAFFESVLIGANYADMLADELAPDANKIRSFLGDFVAVVPTEQADVCGIVRKKGERLYEVLHFTVKTENGKITDIRG